MSRKRHTPPSGRAVLYLDIMERGRFVCQLHFEYCPLWPVDARDIEAFVYDKRPSLKGRDIRIVPTGNSL